MDEQNVGPGAEHAERQVADDAVLDRGAAGLTEEDMTVLYPGGRGQSSTSPATFGGVGTSANGELYVLFDEAAGRVKSRLVSSSLLAVSGFPWRSGLSVSRGSVSVLFALVRGER